MIYNNGAGASPENGDSPERKLIQRLLEDIRDGTLARLLDLPDSEKDRKQLIANLGAIVTVQTSLGVAKAVSDIVAARSEGDPQRYEKPVDHLRRMWDAANWRAPEATQPTLDSNHIATAQPTFRTP
jgi:hypothetical protein